MKKIWWIIIGAILVCVVLISGFFVWHNYKNRQTTTNQSSSSTNSTSIPTTPTQTPSVPTVPTPNLVANPAPTLVYPISNFSSRATTNLFDTYYPPGGSSSTDRQVCSNATYYSGYHTAVDLETTTAEANQNVPIFAIAAGTVKQVSAVSGYGGLIVVQYNLGGADYTAYYGHIDLFSVKVKSGENVSVGETLASLGTVCSSANGNIRKHLHFGLYKGTSIVVSGYVATKSELANWADPTALLENLGAR